MLQKVLLPERGEEKGREKGRVNRENDELGGGRAGRGAIKSVGSALCVVVREPFSRSLDSRTACVHLRSDFAVGPRAADDEVHHRVAAADVRGRAARLRAGGRKRGKRVRRRRRRQRGDRGRQRGGREDGAAHPPTFQRPRPACSPTPRPCLALLLAPLGTRPLTSGGGGRGCAARARTAPRRPG